jgi:phosphatidylethanolamine/phosphatidyl-N-methylethanolamine N-methyltransferase
MTPAEPVKRASNHQENMLFLKRLIKNPKALGAVAPSSKALAEMVARHVRVNNETYVVEVGAGTGRFTRGLLNAGLAADRLIVVEIDRELCQYLRNNFPNVMIIQGDATQLDQLLPPEVVCNVETIISGIPLINLNKEEQLDLVTAFQNTLSPTGHIIQFTYGPVSPLSHKKLGLVATRLGHVFRNVPPATVWSYTFHKGLIHKKRRRPILIYFKFAQQKARQTFRKVRDSKGLK